MITHDKMVERKIVTEQGYGWVLVGVRGCILWPTGHSLVTLFPCLCRLRIGRCTGFLGKSQTYYPKHILVYGRGKAHCSLVMGFGSF